MTDVTLGASGHWLGTRTGAGGIAKMEHVNPITLKNWLKAFLAAAHGSMDNKSTSLSK